jgi:hypothetical protein
VGAFSLPINSEGCVSFVSRSELVSRAGAALNYTLYTWSMANNVPTGLPGSPQGKHSDALAKTEDGCHCGRCSNKRLGWPKEIVVTFK